MRRFKVIETKDDRLRLHLWGGVVINVPAPLDRNFLPARYPPGTWFAGNIEPCGKQVMIKNIRESQWGLTRRQFVIAGLAEKYVQYRTHNQRKLTRAENARIVNSALWRKIMRRPDGRIMSIDEALDRREVMAEILAEGHHGD